jgi:hypothetical protein
MERERNENEKECSVQLAVKATGPLYPSIKNRLLAEFETHYNTFIQLQ